MEERRCLYARITYILSNHGNLDHHRSICNSKWAIWNISLNRSYILVIATIYTIYKSYGINIPEKVRTKK